MLLRSQARTDREEILLVDLKISVLESIGINDHNKQIEMRIVENRLECDEGGSTVDELLEYLGNYCPALTEFVRKSDNDTHSALFDALEHFHPDGYDDDYESLDGCNYGDPHVGSISIQYYIIACRDKSWVAIEYIGPGAWSPCVSGPEVFELHNPHEFHEWFSMFPGILAVCQGKEYIAEPDENCDPMSKHFIDVNRLTSDSNGIYMDGEKVEFRFGGL